MTAQSRIFRATTYHAFRVCQGHDGFKDAALGGRTYDYGALNAGSLPDALVEALSLDKAINHKEHLVIREDGEGGAKLHLYAIKRKAAARYVHQNHITRAVHDLYPTPLCTIDLVIAVEKHREREGGNTLPSTSR